MNIATKYMLYDKDWYLVPVSHPEILGVNFIAKMY